MLSSSLLKRAAVIMAAVMPLCLSATEIDGLDFVLNEEDLTATVSTKNQTLASGDIVIPEQVTYNSQDYTVTSLAESAFRNNTAITSAKILSKITVISRQAFEECTSLASIDLGESITLIDQYAFHNCSSLKSISLPDNLQTIEEGAFWGSGLTEIKIPAATNKIGYFAFWDCEELENIEVSPDNMTFASFDGVVYDKDLTKSVTCPVAKKSVTLPSTLTEISDQSFRNCKNLTTIDFPASLKTIGTQAFLECTGLTSLSIPDGVTTIKGSAFEGCEGLTSASTGNSLTIVESIFRGCSNLTSVEIGSSVEEITKFAFDGCTSLKLIVSYNETPPRCEAGDETFKSVDLTNCSLVVPRSSAQAYSKAPGWSVFNNIIAGVENVTEESMKQPFTVNGRMISFDEPCHTDIYDIAGTIVFSGASREITLPAGFYILVTDNRPSKIVLR